MRARIAIPPRFFVALPGVGWLAVFMGLPLLLVLACAFLKRGVYGGIVYELTFENFRRAFDPLYLRVLFNSLILAGSTTLACLFFAFPLAFTMVRARPATRAILFLLSVLPFWSGLVVRVFAIRSLLQEWTGSPLAVACGMIATYLPFMLLPLYVALERFDFSLVEAATDLGARRLEAIRRVLLPNVRQGIATGCLLVFTPALGEFLIPDLLGGAKTMLLGNLITDQYLKSRDWPFGSALATVLMATVLLTMFLAKRSPKKDSKGEKA